MTYLSICSGIEAATVDWHPLGWKPLAFSEIEKFPSAVLAHHWPDVPNLGDMTQYANWPAFRPELIVGGTPCQAFSVAGLREGLADPRGNLTLTFLAVVERYRPRWVVWENVPGVLCDRTGAFGAFTGGLAKLGYGWAYRTLDAQYFGVPQRRRRVFVVGYLGDWRRAAAVLFESHCMQWHPAPGAESRKVAPCLPSRSTGGGGLGTDFDLDGGLIAYGGNNTAGPVNVATACNAKGGSGRMDFESETFVFHPTQDPIYNDKICHSLGATTSGTAAVMKVHKSAAFDLAQITSAANRSRVESDLPAPTMAKHSQMLVIQAGAMKPNPRICPQSIGIRTDNQAFTLEARSDVQAVSAQGQVRRLTPRECERLQGFPDDYTAIPWRGKPASQCPDGPRYKAIGNSMAVPVMRWIGERINLIEKLSQP